MLEIVGRHASVVLPTSLSFRAAHRFYCLCIGIRRVRWMSSRDNRDSVAARQRCLMIAIWLPQSIAAMRTEPTPVGALRSSWSTPCKKAARPLSGCMEAIRIYSTIRDEFDSTTFEQLWVLFRRIQLEIKKRGMQTVFFERKSAKGSTRRPQAVHVASPRINPAEPRIWVKKLTLLRKYVSLPTNLAFATMAESAFLPRVVGL